VRVAIVAGPNDGCWLSELAEDGAGHGPAVWHDDCPAAVTAYERSGGVRWVWAAAAGVYPALLRAGVRVERCHDIALAETLLLAREGRPGEPASLAGAWARLRGAAAPAFPGGRPAAPSRPGQDALFDPADPDFPDPGAALDAVIEVHADQQRRIAADEHPGRFALLVAAESAGGLIAAEMAFDGLPWRADVHDQLLTELLGPRPVSGMRPAKVADLAARISGALGRPVNPDSPAQVLRALAANGVRVPSTRSGVLRGVDHPAAPLLLEYKELARLHAAHGWAWLDEWVAGGRFRAEYVVGGVVSGRWATRGGGALQIPRVLRRAVVADPGHVLVVADAAQLEPRVLAALAGDRALAAAAGTGDLYEALAGAFGGDRGQAKIALLSAMYGGAGGEAGQLLAVLRRRFPLAAQYVEAAARAGEEGRVVRSRLGRTCPPPSDAWRGLTAVADDPDAEEAQAGRSLRARGRFTRNFVVQASAADWAIVLLAGLRRRLTAISMPNETGGHSAAQGAGPPGEVAPGAGLAGGAARAGSPSGGAASAGRLVFFQHDEVIVHCPEDMAGAVADAVGSAAAEAGQLVFGPTPVRFPVTTAVVASYADAK
jgi:DNA polymerase family A